VDVIHCHDYQTALIPAFLATSLPDDPRFAETGSLFTIHNLAFQGIYPKESLHWADIDARHFYPSSPLEFWGKVNFMKAGIEYSDLVNTVSETYASEIQRGPEYGYGLEGVLRNRRSDLYGIVNGIDYDEWNPETDPHVAAHFSARDLAGKARCKADLLQSLGLPLSHEAKPLIGIVSRLADQKGFDLIEAAAEELGKLDLQMVFLGYGQQRYHEFLESFASRQPEKVAAKISFDDALAHRIYAGSDLCLMPSRYEPCGLSQIISLRYGTVPIVRATGGLVDTVTDCDPQEDFGTGFCFTEYNPAAMMVAIRRARALYSDAPRWKALVGRGISQDWSWEESARKYMKLYDKIYQMRHRPGAVEDSPGPRQ
jgi:starch synthase